MRQRCDGFPELFDSVVDGYDDGDWASVGLRITPLKTLSDLMLKQGPIVPTPDHRGDF